MIIDNNKDNDNDNDNDNVNVNNNDKIVKINHYQEFS